MLPIVEVPIEGAAAVGGAMIVLSWLAYPKKDDGPKRERFIRACKSLLLRRYRWAQKDSEISRNLQKLSPKALSLKRALTQRETTSELNKAYRRINNRLIAADMQAPQNLNIFNNRPIQIGEKIVPLRIKGASTRKLAATIAKRSKQDPEEARVNITSRIWSQSKPVMHLAAALRIWLLNREGRKIEVKLIGRPGEKSEHDLGDLDLVQLVCCPDWLSEVLLWAEGFRLPVNDYPLPGMDAVTIRFLPAD